MECLAVKRQAMVACYGKRVGQGKIGDSMNLFMLEVGEYIYIVVSVVAEAVKGYNTMFP